MTIHKSHAFYWMQITSTYENKALKKRPHFIRAHAFQFTD